MATMSSLATEAATGAHTSRSISALVGLAAAAAADRAGWEAGAASMPASSRGRLNETTAIAVRITGRLLGSGLTRVAEAHPGWVAGVLEVFVGFGALHREEPGSGSGLAVAFRSVGLLCIARLIATAAIQRQGTGGRLAAPLMLTSAVWLICRVVNWWLFDLARGMSPLS